MKKTLILILMSVFMLSVFPGCSDPNDTDNNKNQTGSNRPENPRPFDPDATTNSEPGEPLAPPSGDLSDADLEDFIATLKDSEKAWCSENNVSYAEYMQLLLALAEVPFDEEMDLETLVETVTSCAAEMYPDKSDEELGDFVSSFITMVLFGNDFGDFDGNGGLTD
ncbi:MAG: hypothetical protein MJ185_11900 [Treponema sp.]|nr:hypothetical protein [Treponema sp.]